MDGNGDVECFKDATFPIPKDIIFPDELNRYLRNQIEYLMHENGMLKKNLRETESTLIKNNSAIEGLKNKLKVYENAETKNQYSTTTAITSAKIVELSKKLREKNAETESWKTKFSKLEKKMLEMKDNQIEEKPDNQAVQKPDDEDQMKKLQEKLSATSFKLRELQNSNIHLKNELKLANKYLQQEVGDTLDTISNNNSSGWRGRAQIICDLQQKNQELKDRLKGYQKKCVVEITQKTDKKLDNLVKENDDLKNALNEHKKRNEVLKARCKVLENEQSINKSKIASLIAQTERDQSLMQTLSNQVTNQQDVTNETLKQKDKYIKSLQQDNEVLRIELSKQRCTIENLTKDLNEKIEEIKDFMKNKRKSSRPSSSYGQKNRNEIDEKLISRLEAEKSRLLELTEVLTSKIAAERDAHSKTQQRFVLERQKAAKLETNLAKLELEQNNIRSGSSYATLISSRSTNGKKNSAELKDELELAQETIKALKTRLDIEQQERKMDLKEFSKILQSQK